ncbi:hypothetical protein ABPG75_003145 [Micractinium tetrahymenae]
MHSLVGSWLHLVGLEQLGVDWLLRSRERAQQQGSDLHAANAAVGAAMLAAEQLRRACDNGFGPDIALDSARAVLEAVALAKPALKRCKRLLPQYWLAPTEKVLSVLEPAWEESWARLRLLQAQGDPAGSRRGRAARAAGEQAKALQGAGSATQQAMQRTAAELSSILQPVKCDGCNAPAVAAQLCARCRRSRYCSHACQLAHWPQHRAECSPA